MTGPKERGLRPGRLTISPARTDVVPGTRCSHLQRVDRRTVCPTETLPGRKAGTEPKNFVIE